MSLEPSSSKNRGIGIADGYMTLRVRNAAREEGAFYIISEIIHVFSVETISGCVHHSLSRDNPKYF